MYIILKQLKKPGDVSNNPSKERHKPQVNVDDTVDGSEIPNFHLGCLKPVVSNGINRIN